MSRKQLLQELIKPREVEFRAWSYKWGKMIYHGIDGYTIDVMNATAWLDSADDEAVRLMEFIGLKDENRKKIFEGDIILGEQYYLKGDGYKKKGYPDTIKVICVVRMDLRSFSYPKLIKPIPEHEEASQMYNYRGIGYALNPLAKGSAMYNEKTRKCDIEGDDQTCFGVEVIGNIYDNPDIIE